MEHAGCSCLRGRTWPYQVRPNAKLRAIGSHRWVLSRGVIMASFTFTDYLGFCVEHRTDRARLGPGTPVWSSRTERCWLSPGWGLGETGESMGWGETLEPKAWDLVTD